MLEEAHIGESVYTNSILVGGLYSSLAFRHYPPVSCLGVCFCKGFALNLNMFKAQMLIVNHCFSHFLAPTVLTMRISIERYVIVMTRMNTEAENSPQVI